MSPIWEDGPATRQLPDGWYFCLAGTVQPDDRICRHGVLVPPNKDEIGKSVLCFNVVRKTRETE